MSNLLGDRKNKLSISFWRIICRALLAVRFPKFRVIGAEFIPKSGPFLLIANHSSRWDALVVFDLLKREANYMTSAGELKGLQGAVLPSIGAFPASRKFDLTNFVVGCAQRGEGIVIFPEGNIYKEEQMHPFKKGTAHFVVACAEKGITLPIIPVAIKYEENGARMVVSRPLTFVRDSSSHEKESVVNALTSELYRRVSEFRRALKVSSILNFG